MTKNNISLRDRFRGCMLAGAVGDALGLPIEFMDTSTIKSNFGTRGLTDYAPSYGRCGTISDDTQMTLFTAEGILRALVRAQLKGICSIESCVNHAYLRWLLTQGKQSGHDGIGTDGWLFGIKELHALRSPGNTCISALQEKKNISGLNAPNESKGNGGVMRIAPVGLMFGGKNDVNSLHAAFDLGCNVARLTHGHPSGYLAAGIMSTLVLQLVEGKDLHEALPIALALLDNEDDGGLEVRNALLNAEQLAGSNIEHETAIERLGGGWVAEEALAIAVFCCLRASTLEEALIMAVNHSGDSDSTGSIAGNLMGAWHGIDAIPKRWLKELELRKVIQTIADDLLDSAKWKLDSYASTPESRAIWEKYPGW